MRSRPFDPGLSRSCAPSGAGLLALFLVIAGGTAYAADTIGSSDIIDGSGKDGNDIGNNQVYSADVRDDTLNNGGLSGADIREDSLAKVPDADELDGLSSEAFKVGCPGGLGARRGVVLRAPRCQRLHAAAGRRPLPGAGRAPSHLDTELIAICAKTRPRWSRGQRPGLATGPQEWTGNDQTIYIDSTDPDNMDGVTGRTRRRALCAA